MGAQQRAMTPVARWMVTILVAVAMLGATPALAKDEESAEPVLPAPGPVLESAACAGVMGNILHPPGAPDIPWPFGPGIVAATDVRIDIVDAPGGDLARVTLVDASQNLPTQGEDSGPDAFAFNLPYPVAEENIRVLSPSTFKRFRVDSTPGGGEPFGRFNWEVRRDEHDATPFTFEIQIAGTDLRLSDFGVNEAGFHAVARTNGIFHAGENENRAFSTCTLEPSGGATLGGRVWHDVDFDGIQDAGEPGVAGATVVLRQGGSPVATATTGGDGSYAFAGLTPGTYEIVFAAAGFDGFTAANQGPDDTVDSDADEVTGSAGPITAVAGSSALTWDAGLILIQL